MANRVHSILQIWDDDRSQWETVYASQATPTTTATAINNGAGYNASATSLTVDSTTGILAGDYIKIGDELIQVTTVASGTVLNPVTRGQLTGTQGQTGDADAGYVPTNVLAASMSDNAVVTKMKLGPPALFKTQIEEKHGGPQVCYLELFNRPFAETSTVGYVENRYGGATKSLANMSDYLKEYDRIRVLDNNSKAILFYGRVYRKDIEFDQRYGSIIRITAFDALKELADNRIEGAKGSFTSQTTRSAIVDKIVEKLTYQNASDVNVNLSTDDTQKFTTSVATMSATNKWNYSRGRATGLSAISEVAGGDPHSASSAPSTENGYSYFVDNGFTSSLKTTNYTAATPTLNYFKRGAFPDSSASGHSIRPTAQTFYKMTYGTAESDGDSTNSYTTTVNTMSSFSISKQYTDVITAVTLTYKENNGEVATKTCYRAKVSNVAGTESTAFNVNVLFTTNDSNPETADPADQTSIANSPKISIDTDTGSYTPLVVGRLIYIDATSGNDKFIVFTLDETGNNSEDLHESVLSAASKTSDFIRVDAYNDAAGGDPVSTGANRFTVDATSDVDVELLRTVPATFDSSTSPMEIRKAVFQMFASAQTTTPAKRADLSIIDFPFARLTVDPSSRSGNVLTLPVDLYKFGVRKGMVVRQRKSGVETGNYGYISAIVSHASSPTITVVLNNEAGNATAGTNLPWADSDTFDVYIPIRPGYTAYLTNAPANLTADGMVTGIDYSEGMGIQTTHLSLLTDNFAALNETGHTVPVGGASATPVVTDSQKHVFYTVTAGATTPMLSLPGTSDDYRRVNWAAGTLTVGVEEYSIAASNTYDALSSGWLANDQWYVLYFNKNESTTALKVSSLANLPQDVDLVRIAQLRASSDVTGNAVIRWESGEVLLSAEAGATVDISDISDGAIGTAKFVRGGQPFTMVNSVDSAVDMWSTASYNAVAWTAATLKYSDGDTLTVNAGSSTGLSADTTYWAYVTTTNGNISVTATAADAVGDTKILVALIRVGDSGDVGAGISPLGSQANLATAATIKAGSIISTNIAADAIISDKIAANQVVAGKLSSTALDASTITLTGTGGTAGKLISSAGAVRDGSNHYLSTNFTSGQGVLIDQYGILGNNGGTGADYTQFYASAADGKIYGGAGTVTIDSSGLTISDDKSGLADARFKLADGALSTLEFYCQGAPSHNYIVSTTQVDPDSGGSMDTNYAHNLVIGAKNPGKSAKIIPSANEKVSLGDASQRFLTGYFADIKLGTNEITLGVSSTDLTFSGQYVLKMENDISVDSEYWAFDVKDSSGSHRKFMYPSNATQDGTSGNSYSYIGSYDNSGTWTGRPLTAVQSYYMWGGDGTNSYPGFSFTSDSNTGFYRISTGKVGYSSDGTQEFYMDTGIYPATDSSGGTAGESLGASSQAWYLIHGYTLYMYNSASTTGTDLIVTAGNQIAKKSSSIQYKENVKNLAFDSSKLDILRPVSYDYKLDNAPDIGLIAEEVDEVYPELINYDKEGKPESVKYHSLSVMLLDEVNKLRKEVKILKEKS